MIRFALLLVIALLVAPASTFAQTWPAKTVRVIIPYPPGGGAEAAARFLASHFTQAFGQSFVIDNRPGGNTVIGAEAAAKSPADGYTLFLTGGSTMSVQPFVFAGKLPYDPLADFAPVSMVSRFPFFLVVPATLPAQSLAELVALVKGKPGQLSYASNGSGSIAHLGMEMLKLSTGMDLLHVPYKGFAPALPDLLSGRVTVMMADLAPVGAQLKAGNLRALGVTSRERSGFMPEVPTIAELGHPGYEIDVWFALYAPARTPADIVARLNAETRKYLTSAEAKEAYGKVGHEPAPSSPEEVRARIFVEQKAFAKAVKDANLKPE
jgi:tripartite-type tricarboxylate transporter receptor subunit TctC